MIRFQDPRLYVQGTCNFVLCDVTTGDVKYQDNKFKTNNITTSANTEPIRGGLGDPAVCVIPYDSDINVSASSAAFSLFAKAAQVGAQLSYNAVSPQCQVIEATGTTLTVDVAAAGNPVAPYGYASPFCYVLEVGVANYVGDAGTAYPIDSTTGLISGFNATSGTSYKVWYWVNKASAQVATLSTQFSPGVYHATAQIAVYANQSGYAEGETGTRVGWLYYVIPLLKMGAVANIVGDQTTPDTTDLSGRALYFDETVESGTCGDNTGVLAYYIYVPDDATQDITGLAIVGGVVTLPISSSIQVPVKYVMRGGQLVQPNYSDLSYQLSSPPASTTVSQTGVITSGATSGDCEITVSYPSSGTAQFTVVANVSVTE